MFTVDIPIDWFPLLLIILSAACSTAFLVRNHEMWCLKNEIVYARNQRDAYKEEADKAQAHIKQIANCQKMALKLMKNELGYTQ
jgi:hypothetical protein